MCNTAGSDPLRALIVGCGNIAGGYDAARPPEAPPLTHAGAYRASGLFEIAACVEPDEECRRAFMERWAVKDGFADLDSALAARSYDVVSICTPTARHSVDLRDVLGAHPKAVFCEKPVTADIAETGALVAAYEEAGVGLAVNYTRRWDPAVAALREKLANREWGRIRSVAGFYTKGVFNNGSHLIDLIQLLLGDLRVIAAGAPICDFVQNDPTIPALLATEDGITIQLSCGHASDFALLELYFVLERGMISMEESGFAWRERPAEASPIFPGYKILGAGSRGPGSYDAAMKRAVENIQAAVKTGEPLASTGRTALAAQAVCDGLLQASLKRH